MRSLVYRVTKHTIPRWAAFNEKEPRGIAYETDSHFVHIFGKDKGLWVISTGLTVTQAKTGNLRDWASQTFGAVDVEEADCVAGHAIRGVWRPGLYFYDELIQGLDVDVLDLRLAEQALLLLIQRLEELMNFVEPSRNGLQAFSHKGRELLILACTEAENHWRSYFRLAGVGPSSGADFTTRDYVRLLHPLHLVEYKISLPRYAGVPSLRPFHGWDASRPTKSLPWYDAYNKTKHDRTLHFSESSLWNCLHAVAANVILFSVRYGPFYLLEGPKTIAAMFNQLLTIELVDCSPRSFYAPKIQIPANQRADLICFNSRELVLPWIADPLNL